jgi:hypothetical protein
MFLLCHSERDLHHRAVLARIHNCNPFTRLSAPALPFSMSVEFQDALVNGLNQALPTAYFRASSHNSGWSFRIYFTLRQHTLKSKNPGSFEPGFSFSSCAGIIPSLY